MTIILRREQNYHALLKKHNIAMRQLINACLVWLHPAMRSGSETPDRHCQIATAWTWASGAHKDL